MWISKKKFKSLEKRIADLEGQVQSQQSIEIRVDNERVSSSHFRTMRKRIK